MTADKILKLTREYLDTYRVDEADVDVLVEIGEVFDKRFASELVPFIEKQITISKGAWQLPDDAGAIRTAVERKAKEIGSQIVDIVTTWVTEQFPKYYKRGLELWRINQEMLGIVPKDLKLTKEDSKLIGALMSREIGTWKDHLYRHGIQVGRYVFDGLNRGWTTERFIEAMTSPDGHIVGYLYSDSRISWYEHLKRFAKGRQKVLMQTALERRGNQ